MGHILSTGQQFPGPGLSRAIPVNNHDRLCENEASQNRPGRVQLANMASPVSRGHLGPWPSSMELNQRQAIARPRLKQFDLTGIVAGRD